MGSIVSGHRGYPVDRLRTQGVPGRSSQDTGGTRSIVSGHRGYPVDRLRTQGLPGRSSQDTGGTRRLSQDTGDTRPVISGHRGYAGRKGLGTRSSRTLAAVKRKLNSAEMN